MYVKTGLIAAVIIHIQIVQSQNQVALGKVTSTPYQCDKEIELKCTYIGNDPWDSNANRIWRVDGSLVMTNGIESQSIGKYREGEINTSEKFFILIIKNIEKADLEKKYSCRYSADELLTALTIGGSCECRWCIGRSMAYGIGGLVFGLLIVVFFKFIGGHCKCKCKCGITENNFLLKFVTVAIISFVVILIVAGCIGNYICPCLRTEEPCFILLGLGLGSTLLFILLADFCLTDRGEDDHLCTRIFLAIITVCIWLLVEYIYNECFKELIKKVKAKKGSNAKLRCPYTVTIGTINWFKLKGLSREKYSEDGDINQELEIDLRKRLNAKGKDLFISDVKDSDAGIYECELFQTTRSVKTKLQLVVIGDGKNRSTESGSPEKERADKKKDRKPTEVVRPQPSRPQPSRAQHLKTDNTGRAEYSTETEIYKPRPLPSISRPSDSPRPLPKRTPDDELEKGGIQLEPLVDSTSEKKKKKKRKKKETKQSDEEN